MKGTEGFQFYGFNPSLFESPTIEIEFYEENDKKTKKISLFPKEKDEKKTKNKIEKNVCKN